jgi:hypothetical protein
MRIEYKLIDRLDRSTTTVDDTSGRVKEELGSPNAFFHHHSFSCAPSCCYPCLCADVPRRWCLCANRLVRAVSCNLLICTISLSLSARSGFLESSQVDLVDINIDTWCVSRSAYSDSFSVFLSISSPPTRGIPPLPCSSAQGSRYGQFSYTVREYSSYIPYSLYIRTFPYRLVDRPFFTQSLINNNHHPRHRMSELLTA